MHKFAVLIFFSFFLSLDVSGQAQPKNTMMLPGQIIQKLKNPDISIEHKDKLIDVAISQEFEFSAEEKKELKAFLTDALASPYLSDDFKKKLLNLFHDFEILINKNDSIYSDAKVLLSLPIDLKQLLIGRFYQQGLYDRAYRARLLDLIKGDQWLDEDKFPALMRLVVLAIPEKELNEIRETHTGYQDIVQAVDELDDKYFSDDSIREELDRLRYDTFIGSEAMMLHVNYKHQDGWEVFCIGATTVEDENNDDFDPLMKLANKRLELFSKKVKDLGLSNDRELYYLVLEYLGSLPFLPQNDLPEINDISEDRLHLFVNFLKSGQYHIRLQAVDALNKYHKGKPYSIDPEDWIRHLSGGK